MICGEGIVFYAGETRNMRLRVEELMSNPNWKGLEPDSVAYVSGNDNFASLYALKSALVSRENPLLNCRLLSHDSELPA
jgi:hypothetical protein